MTAGLVVRPDHPCRQTVLPPGRDPARREHLDSDPARSRPAHGSLGDTRSAMPPSHRWERLNRTALGCLGPGSPYLALGVEAVLVWRRSPLKDLAGRELVLGRARATRPSPSMPAGMPGTAPTSCGGNYCPDKCTVKALLPGMPEGTHQPLVLAGAVPCMTSIGGMPGVPARHGAKAGIRDQYARRCRRPGGRCRAHLQRA